MRNKTKMLRTTLLYLSIWIGNIETAPIIEAMKSPWGDPTDPLWNIIKAPDRGNLSDYAYSLREKTLGSLAYIDKLPMQNGSTIYAAVLTDDHDGIGAGFVALGEEPISMARLTRRVVENQQRNLVPVSACGFEETDGRILFESMWMPSKTIEYQMQFENQNQTMESFQNQGYYAVSICSTKKLTRRSVSPIVVIIWHRLRESLPASVPPEQRIFVDVRESECLRANLLNERDLFYPIAMQMFNKGNVVHCSAIWQKMTAPSLKYELKQGSAVLDVVNLSDRQRKPRQISIYRNDQGEDQIMVLWTNYDTRNVSFDGNFYNATDHIPINWLTGSTAGMRDEDKAAFETKVTTLMRMAQIPAISFALSRNEQLKRAAAFGYANPFAKEEATVATKFRLGSVSKVLTAAAIFNLIDQGMLSLNETIFGLGGILGTEYGTKPYSENLLKVRLVNLLEHSSGGWGSETTGDALFEYEGYNQSKFIGIEIDKHGPIVEPGTMSDYANFGYYLLGVIITKVTGTPYDQYIKETFWRSTGNRVGIENRWFSDRQPNEAVFFPDALWIADSYDLIDADRVASAGGWISSAIDWLRVARLFNGFNSTKDVLTPSSLAEMIRPSKASGGSYCRGIAVGVDYFGFGHNGYYPGGVAHYQRQNNGIELMVMLNKGADNLEIANSLTALSSLFIDLTPDWPQQDLFSI